MSWYRRAVNKDFTVGANTPEELLEWMLDIEYGWMGADHIEHKEFGNEFWDCYSLLLPHEVFKYKLGTCWDQTIFENFVFDKEIHLPHVMIFIQQYKVSTHSFLGFRRDGKWYHFESAFQRFKGIHGPYDTIKDMIVAVCKKMHEHESEKEGFGYSTMNPDDFTRKLTCKEFMDACGYDYSKPEKTENQ